MPTILYIFKGREGQQHLQFQMKVMHTRVFGQFAVITMLLTLMGFKEYMDRSGKFITEEEVQARVDQMRESRAELLLRLQRDRLETEAVAEKRRKAHEADMIKSGEIKRLLKEEWRDRDSWMGVGGSVIICNNKWVASSASDAKWKCRYHLIPDNEEQC